MESIAKPTKIFEFKLFGVSVVDFLLAFGAIVFFLPMFVKLFSYGWKNADTTHGAFILPIALFIVFSKRATLHTQDKAKPFGTLLFAAGFLIYVYAATNDFLFLQVTAFVWVVAALFYLRLDGPSFRSVIFPLSYLVFMIPPPGLLIDALTFPLKSLSAYGGYLVLKSCHVAVAVEGAILNVAGNELFVTDACSGFRSIATLLALGALYAYYQPTTLVRKWIIFLSVIPLGILGNIARIAFTGWVVIAFGLKYAEGFFHEFSGLIVFLFTTVGLMIVAALLSSNDDIHSSNF